MIVFEIESFPVSVIYFLSSKDFFILFLYQSALVFENP